MAVPAISTPAILGQRSNCPISSVHSDVIRSHIFTRLDGPSLACAACASSPLHALSTEETLWREISTATWPSINEPSLCHVISTFPAGHRSFYADSFPLFGHRSPNSSDSKRSISHMSDHLISAVDIHYQENLVFSKVIYTETNTPWFHCSPFRLDMVEPKDSVPTPIQHVGQEKDYWLKHQLENLRLSWIVIDPAQKRAGNISSRTAVKVERHWLSGDVRVHYTTIIGGDGRRGSCIEYVRCGVVVTCVGKEEGFMEVREVSVEMEDMDGKNLNGRESLVILREGIGGKRRKGKREEGREREEEYLERKRERKDRRERMERGLDTLCVTVLGTVLVGIFCLLLFR